MKPLLESAYTWYVCLHNEMNGPIAGQTGRGGRSLIISFASTYRISIEHAQCHASMVLKLVYSERLRLSTIFWGVDQVHLARPGHNEVCCLVLQGEEGGGA